MDYNSFFPSILIEIPKFQPVYDEHIAEHQGLLPHVLMGDFTRFLISSYRKSISEAHDAEQWRDVVLKSLERLEWALSSSDDALQNLVSVSFLEDLWQAGDLYEEIKPLLGPRLKPELHLYE